MYAYFTFIVSDLFVLSDFFVVFVMQKLGQNNPISTVQGVSKVLSYYIIEYNIFNTQYKPRLYLPI